jgi:hypothetical protein
MLLELIFNKGYYLTWGDDEFAGHFPDEVESSRLDDANQAQEE